MMNRRNIAVLVLMLIGVSALSGCSTTAIHQDHGYYSGYYSDYYYGPPPLAPLHGYRHYYHGHDLVYDSYLGVYIVLGEVNHYYYRGNYYRYDDHDKHWYCRSGFNKNWYAYDHRTPLPAGLVKKHTKHANIQGRHQETVKNDYRKGDNRHRDNSLQARPGLQYHENRDNTANDRNNRTRNDSHVGDTRPRFNSHIQPKQIGNKQPGLAPDKDNKGYHRNDTGRSVQGIKKNSRIGLIQGNQDNSPGHNSNELKQVYKKHDNQRTAVNRVDQGERDKAQRRTNDSGSAENSRKKSSENNDHPAKSNSKHHGRKKGDRPAAAYTDRRRW